MNRLQIELIEKIDYNGFDIMWLRLTYGQEVRECCFEAPLWDWVEGDIEPIMPPHVKEKWWGKEGDKILDSIWRGDYTENWIE